jgi:DNA-binding SARP family transcriptional activator
VETDGPTSIPAGRLRRAGTQPPARMVVQLLGGFRILVDGSPVDLTPVAERLVAILGLQGRTSRSRLAGMVWPDTPECRALASLRTGIWRVNQAADSLIVSNRSMLDLSPRADVDVRAYVSGAAAQMRSDSAALDAAIDYEGDLLPDWDEDWLLAERERLRQLRLHLLEQLAHRLAAAGRFGLALEAAFTALCADPLRESAHRAIIGIHLAEGNMGEARRAYENCRRTLAQDLGVEPSPATARLVGVS